MTLARVLRTNRLPLDGPPEVADSPATARTSRTATRLVRTTGWVNGVKSGHTSQAGYVLVGSGRRNRIQLVSAVLGTPSIAARDATKTLPRQELPEVPAITVVRRGTVMTRVPIRYRRGAELALEAGRTVRRIVPRGQRDDVDAQVVGRPDDVAGPILAGKRSAPSRSSRTAAWCAPLVAASSVPAADLEQKAKSWFTSPPPRCSRSP